MVGGMIVSVRVINTACCMWEPEYIYHRALNEPDAPTREAPASC